MSWSLRNLVATVLAPVLTVFAPAEEFDLNEIERDLDGPVQLGLANGSLQTGSIASWDGETLRLEIELDAGSAAMIFRAEEVDTIRFVGDIYIDMLREMLASPNQISETLDLFRAIYKQRGAFMEFLDPEDLLLFARYAQFALKHNEPLRAVAIIEVLKPHLEDSVLIESLNDAALLGFFLGGLKEEAIQGALEWIERTPPAGPSALGWRILAEMHFTDERFEEALWTALYPIAFAHQMEVEHLDACYAFAIAAAQETRQPEISERLWREMQAKALVWPLEIENLEKYRTEFETSEPSLSDLGNDISDESAPIEEEIDPLQSPSPIDPVESLPTRIQQISKANGSSNQSNTNEND